tara:strand:- start:12492 stop:12767 length:276 start_codon:yes stop_codon:yes gene_type:complete
MIKAPKWCKDAIPTSRGWESPTTGEVYTTQKIHPQDISEFHAKPAPAAAPAPAPAATKPKFGKSKSKPKFLQEVTHEAEDFPEDKPESLNE